MRRQDTRCKREGRRCVAARGRRAFAPAADAPGTARAQVRAGPWPPGQSKVQRDSCAFANTRRCESGVQHGIHQAGGWRRSSWRWARRSRSPQRRPRRPPRAWRGTRSAAPWHAGSWQLTIRCAEMRFLARFSICAGQPAQQPAQRDMCERYPTTTRVLLLLPAQNTHTLHRYMCVEEQLEGGLHTVLPISSYHSVRNQQPMELWCA